MEQGKHPYNYGTIDFPSEEGPGLSVFYKDGDGQIYHTYSTYGRGLDILLTTYNLLDMTPKGRDEEGMTPHAMAWVRHHDRYETEGAKAGCCSGEAAKSRKLMESTVGEYLAEVEITRRILSKVPADKLTWKPHGKSMTLGQLALHIAQIPDRVSALAQRDGFDVSQANFVPEQPDSLNTVLTGFEAAVVEGEKRLRSMTDEAAMAPWTMTAGGRTVFTVPRAGIVRTIMLNHWYHHRGQLSVYLRMLDIPVPVIYGRSADENPFA